MNGDEAAGLSWPAGRCLVARPLDVAADPIEGFVSTTEHPDHWSGVAAVQPIERLPIGDHEVDDLVGDSPALVFLHGRKKLCGGLFVDAPRSREVCKPGAARGSGWPWN